MGFDMPGLPQKQTGYVAPVGEKERYVDRAMAHTTPWLQAKASP